MSKEKVTQVRHVILWLLLGVGVIMLVLSLAADSLGLNLTPGFGIVQMVPLLLGISCFTLVAFVYVHEGRPPHSPRSLQADIAVRLAATGLVFLYVSGLSDLIGIGTHSQPNFERPFVGPLQLGGMGLGLLSILIGLYLYHTSRGTRASSSMQFLINDNSQREEN
ncbi:MAG: hypothetical protein H6658_13685 [Ardenticatenaceae bacterium]|nr:hypothetical protein [Ardenticatenaceae bacterium]